MGDAEIIPIGTRGRPGRGQGASKPSAASRSLAPGGAKRPPRQEPARRPEPSEPPEPEGAVDGPDDGARKGAADDAVQVRETGTPRAPVTTGERSQGGGIPVGDWIAAFQHASMELFGDQWEPQLARFLAFLRRRLAGDYVVDEYGFDQEVTEQFLIAALRPIAEKWFRIEVRGIENIPSDGGALVVSNHSGTLPVDGLMTMVVVHDHAHRFLRALGADLVFRMPLVSSLARKGGATLACNEDAERMLRGGELVGMRAGAPIVPLSVVGAEEIYPLVANLPSVARALGFPYLPITPFFPLLGPLGLVPLPSKWLLEFGEPIRTDEFDPGAADDPMLVFNVTDQVRETIQSTLYSLLMQRQSVFR
jgi:1-acyl-sn-glycerol-3-phosphate acyltransferase